MANVLTNFVAPLTVAAIVAGGGALVTWGAVGSKVDSHETRVAGLEQRERERQDRDSILAQRVTAIDTKLDFLIRYFGIEPGAPPPERRTFPP